MRLQMQTQLVLYLVNGVPSGYPDCTPLTPLSYCLY